MSKTAFLFVGINKLSFNRNIRNNRNNRNNRFQEILFMAIHGQSRDNDMLTI